MKSEGICLADCALRLGLAEKDLRELAELSQDQSLELLAQIEEAVEDRDLSGAQRHGHSLKNVCMLFGADAQAARQMEQCADLGRAQGLLPALFAQVGRLRDQLDEACRERH